MENLRLAHHFFQFSQKTRLSLWGEGIPSGRDIDRLFREAFLPRRALKSGPVSSRQEAEREFSRIRDWEAKVGARVIESRDFPPALAQYIPPERLPPLLYARGGGEFPPEQDCVAIVGTRYPSQLGNSAARDFSAYFATQNLRVVSGLAKGVDTLAHRESLRLGTIAVLGSGIDEIYPTENSVLAETILDRGGILLSPFPLTQVPLPSNFPQRNELIAALSVGTVVIEGNETSGAAVTGKQGLSMGKCVVALPQDYRTGFGRGAIALQQAGALLVCSPPEALQGIFSRVGGFSRQTLPELKKSRGRTFSFRDFLAASKTDTSAALAMLEEGLASGRIEKDGPDRYRLKRKENSLAP